MSASTERKMYISKLELYYESLDVCKHYGYNLVITTSLTQDEVIDLADRLDDNKFFPKKKISFVMKLIKKFFVKFKSKSRHIYA